MTKFHRTIQAADVDIYFNSVSRRMGYLLGISPLFPNGPSLQGRSTVRKAIRGRDIWWR